MSYAGIIEFKKNLDKLMCSEKFKNASESEKMKMGSCLIRCNNSNLDSKLKVKK